MYNELKSKFESRAATVGIIGLGYVGLPLMLEFVKKGFYVVGFDTDSRKIEKLGKGDSYIRHISSARLVVANGTGRLKVTTDFAVAKETDALIVCVPTPLTKNREPDMSYIVSSCEAIAPYLHKGQLVSLESTTYPGTCLEVMKPILEKISGLKLDQDFYIAFSPEREDPNNPEFETATIPKVVGCDSQEGLDVAKALYDQVVVKTVPVRSTKVAEATKLIENIFRSVNIALVNELKVLFNEMGIDVWEVINAAATKPFGFMPFYPGPGLGGHCIPIDPFYLTWKAYEYDFSTKFIELAGEINTSMPRYVVQRTAMALNKQKKNINGSKILLVGLAYKKDVDDMRESPSLKLMELLEKQGALIDYYDPYIPVVPENREHPQYIGCRSVPIEGVGDYDCVLIATAHSVIDYNFLYKNSRLIVDTRNVVPRGENVYSA